MQSLLFKSITVDEIDLSLLKEKNVKVSVLRLDKIHPVISGNKWFKLKYYLEEAKSEHKDHIVTFGGAYSNHIIATAAACKLYGYKTTGIIRGEQAHHLSHTLLKAKEYGMQLLFINREEYKKKKLPDAIKKDVDRFYIIPEGGYGALGAKGASEILDYCKKEMYSHVACATGTSAMMAGLIKTSYYDQEIVGIAAMKNNTSLETELYDLLLADDTRKKFKLIHGYHFGGYAKYTKELVNFMNEFYTNTSIPTDFVYTGKLFYGVFDMIEKNFFPSKSNILIIHSGGLQGNLSLPKRTLIF